MLSTSQVPFWSGEEQFLFCPYSDNEKILSDLWVYFTFLCVYLKENTSVKCDSVTEEKQLTSGTEPANQHVEEPGSPVKPQCRKRRHSSQQGKSLVRDSPFFRGGQDSCSETLPERGDHKS